MLSIGPGRDGMQDRRFPKVIQRALGDQIKMVEDRLRRLAPKWKILLLMVLTIVIYGTTIALTWANADAEGAVSYDIDIYRARTQAILDGELLYRDVHTETPPLINYFLVPAQLLGGAEHYWVWSAYEAAFAFLLASMLYLVLRRYDDYNALLVGFLVLLCPFLIDETAIGEDGALVAFVFFSAVVLMLLEKNRYAAVAIGIGIWTKMWSVLLLPTQFLRLPTWKERFVLLLIVGAVTLAVTTPFLILCFDEFMEFLNFYLLGDPERSSGGLSVWNFLRIGGYGVPEAVELLLVLSSLLAAYLFAHWKRLGVWESITLVVIVFVIFYPKMHMGYYILPTVLLAMWAVEDWRIAIQPYIAFMLLSVAVGFLPEESSRIADLFDDSWIAGLLFSLGGTLLFVNAARMSLARKGFIVRKGPEGEGRVFQ